MGEAHRSELQATTDLKGVRAGRNWSPWRRPGRTVRRGVLATVLAPLAMAAGLLAVGLGVLVVGTSWWTGYSRDQVFSRAVQPDGSFAAIDTGPALEETVTILVRDEDGAMRRLVVERSDADRFLNDMLRRLDRQRAAAVLDARAAVDALMATAFADADVALERHADWFFSWHRSYVVLKEATVSAATRLLSPGAYEPLQVAVARDLETYFMRHYLEMVLQPELREPGIRAGFEGAARHAHAGWLAVVAEQDRHLQRFLAESTRPLEAPAPDQRLATLTLDWTAQAFKTPRALTADKAFDGALGLATATGGAAIGAGVLGPAVAGSTRRLFAGLARRQAAAMAGRLAMAQGGAALGTAVQPVGGTAIGAVAGGLVGLALDYTLNEADAARNRTAFIDAHASALEVTMAAWQSRLASTLEAAIDQWFADTRAALVLAD